MITIRTSISRGLALLAVAAVFTAVSLPVLSNTSEQKTGAQVQDPSARRARMNQRVETHLNELSKRLNINGAQQQAAWSSYANVVRAQTLDLPTPPAKDADAVTVLRFRADMAAKHAQKLTQLADATAQLAATLTPEQRETLNKSVRRGSGEFGHTKRGSHGPERPRS